MTHKERLLEKYSGGSLWNRIIYAFIKESVSEEQAMMMAGLEKQSLNIKDFHDCKLKENKLNMNKNDVIDVDFEVKL